MSNYKRDIILELLICMKEADIDKWMTLVYSLDDLVNEASRDWFYGRIKAQRVTDIQLDILEMDYQYSENKTKCKLVITYEEYEPITEIHIYTFGYIPERDRTCIIWLEKERKYFPSGLYDETYKFEIKPMKSYISKPWWKNKTLVNEFVFSNDNAMAEKYARAIIRNVRFREGCLELECASLLSNMMSERLNELYNQIYDKDKKILLSNIYNATRDFFKVQLKRDDRDNSWSSKFVAPWYGFDELMELNNNSSPIKGSCFNFISFIYALLRICGFPESDIYQLRLINQDILVVFIETRPYIVDSDNIIPWNNKSLYFRNRVSKMFTETWCIADKDYVGISRNNLEREISKIEKCFGEFNFFNNKYSDYNEKLLEENSSDNNTAISFDSKKSFEDIVGEVIKRAKMKNDSVYVWAKYAHQILYVTKPEAYLKWSIQSRLTIETLCQYEKFYDWLNMARTFEKKSIFCEDFRLMTADQCIRYKKGDSKSILAVLYVWFVIKEKQEGIILYTTKSNYFIYSKNGQTDIWNGDTLEKCSEIEGKIILAFNHKESYYPLLHGCFDISLNANELADYMLNTKERRTKTAIYNFKFFLPKRFGYKLERIKDFGNGRHVLFLSSHYDDDVIGCGGIISECCKSGCICSVVYFTDRTKNKQAIGVEDYKEIRKSEAYTSLKELGNVNIYCLEEKDGELSVCNDVVDKIKNIIIESKADTIFFPNIKDSYSDHNIVGKILSMSLESNDVVNKLYMYEIIECLQEPDTYFEMNESVTQIKQNAIGKHKTQLEYMDYQMVAQKLNQIRGEAIGKKMCEVFQYIDRNELYQYYHR
ncbi:MAG: PIG-L family deacetylase [Lachnospiraceae bacterium]|nr:PIG-L family deacetylase [Lachnospiraceae bacterium]